jgi:pimeloyl-ACP methyl ester carboxylesterase
MRKLRRIMAGQQREALPRCRTAPPMRVGLYGVLAALAFHAPSLAQTLLVGSIGLRPCQDSHAYCGELERPLDPTGAVPGHIAIHFEFYPHTGPGKAVGTLVATEGGPGYPATESRDDYLALFKPLLPQHDFLMMDNRGTGQSGAVNCPALQAAEKWTVELTAACGESLGSRAPLYSTAYAADDLAAILEALHIRRIDLYGDSYGTYFEQVFAVRHPNILRSIVLDGAYPLNGADYAWYPSYAPAMRDKFDIACRRFAPCARLPGSSMAHIQPMLQELRSHPFTARAADSDGKERKFSANASQLAIVMFGSAPAFATVRELDAAARAFIEGDRIPVLRLMAETISGVDSRDPTADPTRWSAGLAAAVMCQDPPQIFDMRLAPDVRIADRDQAIIKRKGELPDTYAPFTIDEYRAMPLDYSFIDQCVEWPVAPSGHPASHVVGADPQYPDIPALVISGELDNMTTMADGAQVARAFKHGSQIRIANSFHVNALPRARSACAAQIVRRFMDILAAGDTSCAAEVPPLRLVPRFALRSAQLTPARALAGNQANAQQLRQVSAAVLCAGDVLARLGGNSTGLGAGLRGGSFRIAGDADATHVSLDQVRWTEDLSVSGKIDKPLSRSGLVRAALDLQGTDGSSGRIVIQWREGSPQPIARIRGRIGAAAVVAEQSAP